MFELGGHVQELLVIFVVALLVVGPKRLPEPAPSEPSSLTALAVSPSVVSTPATKPDTGGGLCVEPYLAQRGSRLFHARECRWAVRIPHVDRVAFERADDAEAQGLRRCPACEPPG